MTGVDYYQFDPDLVSHVLSPYMCRFPLVFFPFPKKLITDSDVPSVCMSGFLLCPQCSTDGLWIHCDSEDEGV